MTGEFVGGILEQETKKEVPPQMAVSIPTSNQEQQGQKLIRKI
jgi:hypothetical protein